MAHTPEEPAGRDLIAYDTGIHIHISDGLLHITGDPSGTTITIEADMAPHLAHALLAEWADQDDMDGYTDD